MGQAVYRARLIRKNMILKQEVNERAQTLFKALVERYIRDGQPVGSRTLARDAQMDLSPATIRNVMADLEEFGLISSPHTSAGRIPTALGYRFFVDSLLTVKPMRNRDRRSLKEMLGQTDIGEPQQLLSSASRLLSEITAMAGVVMVPRSEQRSLRQVEFLSLSQNRVLVILVINEREVQNRIIHTSRHYSAAELQEAANYLNQAFGGQDIKAVRQRLVKEMEAAKEGMNRLMLTTIEMAQKAFTEEEDSDFVLAGQTNLMNYAEIADMERLRQLFDAFSQKRDILHLLDQVVSADGVQIYIGGESGYTALDECSVVASPYEVEGETVGVLGVIGPKRMAYDRVISIVDVTAKLLGSALKQTN